MSDKRNSRGKGQKGLEPKVVPFKDSEKKRKLLKLLTSARSSFGQSIGLLSAQPKQLQLLINREVDASCEELVSSKQAEGLVGGTSPDLADVFEWLQERAAIMEYDGGLTRDDAESAAMDRVIAGWDEP